MRTTAISYNVYIAAGSVTLTAGGGAFRAWLDRSDRELPPLLLVDGVTRPTLTMSLAKWRALAGLMGNEDEARTRIRVTSATPGARTLASGIDRLLMHGIKKLTDVGDIPDNQVYGISKDDQKGFQNVGASNFDE